MLISSEAFVQFGARQIRSNRLYHWVLFHSSVLYTQCLLLNYLSISLSHEHRSHCFSGLILEYNPLEQSESLF